VDASANRAPCTNAVQTYVDLKNHPKLVDFGPQQQLLNLL